MTNPPPPPPDPRQPPPRPPKPLLFDHVDPTFREDLAKSHSAVLSVGEWLLRVYDWKFKAPEPKADGHPDNDLWVLMPKRDDPFEPALVPKHLDPMTWQLWQVKQRPGMHFTTRDGYPYQTVFVGNTHDYLTEGRQEPDWVAVVNGKRTGALIVSGNTKPSWHEKRGVWCPTRGRHKNILECDRDLMTYRELVA